MELGHIFKKTTVNPSMLDEQTATPEMDTGDRVRPEVPDGLLKKCNKCGKGVFTLDVKNNHYICPKCGGYLRMPAYSRIRMVTDPDSFEEWGCGMKTDNPLHLKNYPEKVKRLQEKTGLDEAIVTGKATIGGIPTVIMVMDGRFLMASLGKVVGEKITRAVERATKEKLPVIIFSCSGGARMQEGTVSLMQMAKTSAALKRHSDAGLLYISVLTDPTTGGVAASFANLGDIILAEPGALIGFAGPRVIEQTIRQKLPKGFQLAEFQLEHGFVDRIVERMDMRDELFGILKLHQKKNADFDTSGKELIQEPDFSRAKKMTSWERVELSRKRGRPTADDYIAAIFDDFTEMHGDRYYGDDPSVCGGIASFHGIPVTVIAQMKGKNTKDNLHYNFGMPEPEGYRKALRLMKQAEKFGRPVICFVDTPGAYPGMEAEERGQGEAIARNIYEMSSLKTPILSILIGEGGSGGALALAVADQVWMMENAIYSILSPEGYASILWKDAGLSKKAARIMRLTSYDLYRQGIIEKIIQEPEDYNLETVLCVCDKLSDGIERFLKKESKIDTSTLIDNRYHRFRVL